MLGSWHHHVQNTNVLQTWKSVIALKFLVFIQTWNWGDEDFPFLSFWTTLFRTKFPSCLQSLSFLSKCKLNFLLVIRFRLSSLFLFSPAYVEVFAVNVNWSFGVQPHPDWSVTTLMSRRVLLWIIRKEAERNETQKSSELKHGGKPLGLFVLHVSFTAETQSENVFITI